MDISSRIEPQLEWLQELSRLERPLKVCCFVCACCPATNPRPRQHVQLPPGDASARSFEKLRSLE